MAAVRADISPAIAREVSRFCLKKGVWSTLLQPIAAWERAHGILEAERETPGDSFSCNPLWDVMSRAFPYSTTWVKHVTRSEHINILEMKALVAEEKRFAEKFCSLRVLAGLDSQVSLGSLVKGRASSKAINNILRQSMPYSISSDIQMHYMYYNTKHNRSDGPTRNKDPAPPDMEQPPWVDDLPQGKTGSFDAWMRIHCRELVKHEVPFNEIGGPDDVDIRSSRATRGSNYFNSRGGPQHSGVEARRDCCSGVLSPEDQADVKKDYSVPPAAEPSQSSDDWKSCSLLCEEAITILESFSKTQFFFSGVPGEFLEPGGIDLFSGRRGVARQMISFGAPWVMTVDYDHGRSA